MKKAKKHMSVVLVLLLIISSIVAVPTTVSASTSHTQTEAVAWVKSQNGAALDYDGAYGAQCVDLIMYYYSYLGVSSPGGNAKDYISNSLPSGWTRTSSPSAGDIVVWGAGANLGKSGYTADSTYGHIGIVTEVNGGTISYYDQNAYPQGQVVGGHSGHDASSAATYIHPDFSGSNSGYTASVASNITVDVSGADDPDDPSSWYAWTWDGVEDHWVSGYGDDTTAVHFDGVGGYVKFVRMPWGSDPNWDTAWNQTGDIAVTGSNLRLFWTQNAGEVGYEWTEGGDNPGGDNPGGEESYYPGPGNGPYTVVLDASGVDTGYVDWRAWTWATGSEGGYWVGATGTDASDITYTGLEDNVVFAYFTPGSNTGWDGKIGQTVDMTVDGDTFTVTKAEAGDGGVEGSWSGSTGGGSDEGDVTGDATVYLDPADYASDGEWYAYTWATGSIYGTWVSGNESDGVYSFSGISDNVIFVSASGYPESDWANCVAQTYDLLTMDGQEYVISSQREPDGDAGEMRPIYEGDWQDGGQPDTQETEPDTQETQAPTGDVQPDTTVPGGDSEDGPLTAVIKLNGAEVKKQEVYGDTLKVTYNVTCPEIVVDGQASLTYNKEKLTLESWEFPVVDASVIDNFDKGLFNFSSVKSPYDFTKGDKLVVCNFKVVDGAKGEASINLQIVEFDSFDTVYAADGQITADGQAIIDSMKNVDVDAGTPASQPTDSTQPTTGIEPVTQVTEPTQQPTTEKPTEAPDPTQPETDPDVDALIKTDNVKTTAGSTVEVPVVISDNPGVVGMTLSVKYDTSALKLTGVKDGGILGANSHKPEYKSPYTLSWANDTATENYTKNGTVATLTFEVLEDAAVGKYPIQISYNYDNYGIYNKDLDKVKFNVQNGYIQVIDYICGDVTSDGLVNNLDRVYLTRYLADWDNYQDINIEAADVNGDGNVNNLDRVILTRHLADWEDYATLPYKK